MTGLVVGLAKYGRHLASCAAMKSPYEAGPFACTCGLSVLLESERTNVRRTLLVAGELVRSTLGSKGGVVADFSDDEWMAIVHTALGEQ